MRISSQTVRRDHLLLIHYQNCVERQGEGERESEGRGEEGKKRRLCARWGGRGGGASVGEAEGCVLA